MHLPIPCPSAQERDARPEDQFCEKLRAFHGAAEEELARLKDRVEETVQQLDGLGQFFGEGKGQFDSRQFFGSLATFCDAFDEVMKKKGVDRDGRQTETAATAEASQPEPATEEGPAGGLQATGIMSGAQAHFAQCEESDTVWR